MDGSVGRLHCAAKAWIPTRHEVRRRVETSRASFRRLPSRNPTFTNIRDTFFLFSRCGIDGVHPGIYVSMPRHVVCSVSSEEFTSTISSSHVFSRDTFRKLVRVVMVS